MFTLSRLHIDKNMDVKLDNALSLLSRAQSKGATKDIIWKAFLGSKCDKRCCGRTLKVALINAPCHGFGDIVFGQKFACYLRKWYNAKVSIFTTREEAHTSLGENPANLIGPKNMKDKTDCYPFADLRFPKVTQHFDLYFVCPVISDYSPSLKEVESVFKYATRVNTFFMSEYNAPKSGIDFPTGVGMGRLGMLLVKPPKTKRLVGLTGPYALMYLAGDDHVSNADKCAMAFMEMVTTKYSYPRFSIVAPEWVSTLLVTGSGTAVKRFLSSVSDRYPNLIVIDSAGYTTTIYRGRGPTLTIRGDVLPVDNKQMLSLIRYSVDDILLTGDQSITDALSCCPTKVIYYQIATWKESLARALVKELPNKYLAKKSTSCGTLSGVKYNPDQAGFVDRWDFRKLARPKLDAIVRAACAVRSSDAFEELADIIATSRTLASMKKRGRHLIPTGSD